MHLIFYLLEPIVEFTSSQFTGSESAGSVTVMITKSNALSITNISVLITLTPMSAMGKYILSATIKGGSILASVPVLELMLVASILIYHTVSEN